MGESAPVAPTLAGDDETPTETFEAFDTTESIESNGAEIWARVRARVEQQLAIVELHAHLLLDRSLTDDEIDQVSTAASSLARGLGLLQQDRLAQLARHIEQRMGEPSLEATTGVHIAAAVEDLRTMLASAVAQLESARAGAGLVLAIGEPSAHFDALLWILASRGHRILHEGVGLPRPGRVTEPAAVVVAVGSTFTNRTRFVLQAAAETYEGGIVALHDDAPFEVQCRLAAFCATLLPLSSPPDAVAEEIMRHRAARHAELSAIVCGADEAGPLLEAYGFAVTIVPDADDLLAGVTNDGTAVVLGSSVPSDRVLSLTRLIRATPAARQAPVVWLPGDDETESVILQAHRLGILIGGSLDDDVAVRITAQMRRAVADAGPDLTDIRGLLSWPASQVLIDRSLVAAQRVGTPTSLATIDVGDQIDDDHLPHIEEILTREFRRGDVVGQRDDRRFVVALQGAARRVGVARMGSLAPRLAPGGDGIRIGVAEFPSDGRSADELLAAADAAVSRAIGAAGPDVVSTTWRNAHEEAVDVLVVDPDPILGEMVSAMLTERGYTCDRLTDGRDALDRLTTVSSEALPKVLMIDVDITGVDGLALLRSLRPSGVLTHTQVLVVSARAVESDIRAAFDFGAADIVRKPFSATLLGHRVGRLLER